LYWTIETSLLGKPDKCKTNLKSLEEKLMQSIGIRPHWGLLFFGLNNEILSNKYLEEDFKNFIRDREERSGNKFSLPTVLQ